MSLTEAQPQVSRHGFVAMVEMRRPPNNFVDAASIEALAACLEALDVDPDCRSIVLASHGKHFCAGADLGARLHGDQPGAHIYDHAVRLVRTRKPIVAAVQGAAVGAGLGLAMIADFRVASASARLSANFSMQGYHPGFGLTLTLPMLLGVQHANWMLLTGRRIKGNEALAMGLVDRLVGDELLHESAMQMAGELAAAGPLAVQAIRSTLRRDFASRFVEALRVERKAQDRLRETEDYREGVRAMNARCVPAFRGR